MLVNGHSAKYIFKLKKSLALGKEHILNPYRVLRPQYLLFHTLNRAPLPIAAATIRPPAVVRLSSSPSACLRAAAHVLPHALRRTRPAAASSFPTLSSPTLPLVPNATGNCTASVIGRTYPGAGASIAASFVFGWLAAHHMIQNKARSDR